MSMYNVIDLEIKLINPLNRDDMCDVQTAVGKAQSSSDTIDDINTIIHLSARFNYNMDAIYKIMSILERYCMYDVPTKIGTIDSESCSINEAALYAYKDRIVIVIEEYEGVWGFPTLRFNILDAHANRLSYTYDIKNGEDSEDVIDNVRSNVFETFHTMFKDRKVE